MKAFCEIVPDTFLYFAYGSNLLKKRIHINNPSAEYLGIGRLNNHRLDFITWSPRWCGASATIVIQEMAHVWGAVWRVHNVDMPALDKQEGVDTNWYFPKNVDIVMEGDVAVKCRTYQQSTSPPALVGNEQLPVERQPSKTYLDVIIKGALECGMPDDYIRTLKKIPHNGKQATSEMLKKLEL